MKKVYSIFLLLVVIFSLGLSYEVITHAKINQKNKMDLAELNHIRYGLFSVDSWKEQITDILLEEIDKIDLTTTHQRQLKNIIEAQLHVLIEKVNERMREINKGTLTGYIKQRLLDTFVKVEKIKEGIPSYADAIIQEIKKPRNKGKLKDILKKKMLYYLDQSYDPQNTSKLSAIIDRTESETIQGAKIKLAYEIGYRFEEIKKQSLILLLTMVIAFLLPFIFKISLSPIHVVCLGLLLLTLLAAGITTPMIDLEARISKMRFILMDNPIEFKDQVLFFQSKSIMDVFWLMIRHAELKMKFTGLLLVNFSLVFPLLKMISSFLYYFKSDAKDNKLISFFVLKAGKWSMADVLVIAIFMSYIGFSGVINSQLGHLRSASEELMIMTTNGTNLQPGFYLFLGYVLLSLFFTTLLIKKYDQ